MSKMPIATTLAALAFLAGTAAQAGENKFRNLDADANGYISQEEAASNADLQSRWQDLDADQNNQLDMSEFSAFETGTDETTPGSDTMMKDKPMGEGGMMEKSAPSSTPKY